MLNTIDTRETAQSLDLAISQIDMALKEADGSVTDLIGAITGMTCSVNAIDKKLEQLSDNATRENTINQIRAECLRVDTFMHKAVMAFQFYDRLSQRFQHIHENLHAVANVIRAPGYEHPALWRDLRAKISSVYTLEQEQHLLQIFNSTAPAADKASVDAATQHANEDIELF